MEASVGTSWGQNLLFKAATVDRRAVEKRKGGTTKERIKGKVPKEGMGREMAVNKTGGYLGIID